MNEKVEALMKPFPKESIKRREGPFDKVTQKKKFFDYIGGNDVLSRLLEIVDTFTWEILCFKMMPSETVTKQGNNGEYTVFKSAYWIVHGRLTIEGLGSRDGIGTQVVENEDSAKGAETDALKRAAVKYGVALSLYEDAHPDAASDTGYSQPQETRTEGWKAGGGKSTRPHTEVATEKGMKRMETLFLQWEANYTLVHLAEVAAVEIVEDKDEREALWKTFHKLTSAQLAKVEAELGLKPGEAK